MPLNYKSGILKEHLATRRFGGIFDVSHMGRFRIYGKDTVSFLQHVLTNNVESIANESSTNKNKIIKIIKHNFN